MIKASNRAHRFSVMCAVATVVSLGWSPLHALAGDGAIDAVGSSADGATDQVADAVTATADPVDAVSEGASTPVEAVSDGASSPVKAVTTTTSDPIDTVSNTASNTVDTVSNTTSNTVDTASNTTSNTVDTVSNTTSNTVDTASNTTSGTVSNVSGAASGTVGDVSDAASGTVSNVSGAVGDTTARVGGSAPSVTSGSLTGAGQANETVAATSSTPLFSSQRAAADRRSTGATPRSIHDDLVLLAQRGRAPALDTQGPGSCSSTVSADCETTAAGDAPGSWEGSVASIIQKLLALTGSGLLTWIMASCILTIMGAMALHESKRRSRGEGYPLGSA